MSEKRQRGRPRKPPGEAKTEMFRARVTAKEKQLLQAELERIRNNPSE